MRIYFIRCRFGRVEACKVLINIGKCSPNAITDVDCWTPMHHAALNGQRYVVEFLLSLDNIDVVCMQLHMCVICSFWVVMEQVKSQVLRCNITQIGPRLLFHLDILSAVAIQSCQFIYHYYHQYYISIVFFLFQNALDARKQVAYDLCKASTKPKFVKCQEIIKAAMDKTVR